MNENLPLAAVVIGLLLLFVILRDDKQTSRGQAAVVMR